MRIAGSKKRRKNSKWNMGGIEHKLSKEKVLERDIKHGKGGIKNWTLFIQIDLLRSSEMLSYFENIFEQNKMKIVLSQM